MPTTPIGGLRYPALSDNPNGPLAVQNLAEDVADQLPGLRYANDAARDAEITSPGDGMTVWLDTPGAYFDRIGGAWVQRRGDVTLDDAHVSSPQTLGANYGDSLTISATSIGGLCTVRFTVVAYNAASGADRTMDVQVVCDGVVVGAALTGISVPLNGSAMPRITRVAAVSSTPAAGSHTWKLQTRASIASAVVVESALMTVVEHW